MTDARQKAASAAALAHIPDMDDPGKLRALIVNAKRLAAPEVEHAAFSRLCDVQPTQEEGSVAHDVWRSIFAHEELLREERGRTVLLTRTRQKIAKEGEHKTVADLTLKDDVTDGFEKLVSRGHPELLFEAVVLRHPDEFDEETRAAATARFNASDIELASIGLT